MVQERTSFCSNVLPVKAEGWKLNQKCVSEERL